MDRSIVYPGSIPLDTDLLNASRDAMIGLGALIAATLGSNPVVDGLEAVPTTPASAGVIVGPGSITQLASIDFAAYGTLGTNASSLVKMGISTDYVSLACPAPGTPGTSVIYLIEASFLEIDAAAIVLPYYNAAAPTQPFLGPAGGGASQPTRRLQQVALTARAGVAAATGSEVAPGPDGNAVGLALVTISAGQTSIQLSDISPLPTAPTVQFKLPDLRPGFASVQTFTSSGSFVVPAGVTRAKITVTGGGGAGGTHATQPGAGGGSGGLATAWVGGLVPGTVIAVTVGAGGSSSAAPSTGGGGGPSAFGGYLSATGGQGGQGGTDSTTPAGGAPGQGSGGNLATAGSSGGDAIPISNRGGDGGGPGNGRGSTGAFPGVSALGYGGGGGGGGPGQPGGGGGGGLVIVEY